MLTREKALLLIHGALLFQYGTYIVVYVFDYFIVDVADGVDKFLIYYISTIISIGIGSSGLLLKGLQKLPSTTAIRKSFWAESQERTGKITIKKKLIGKLDRLPLVMSSEVNDRISLFTEVRAAGMFGRIIKVYPVLAILFVVVNIVNRPVAKEINDGLLQAVEGFFITRIQFGIQVTF